MALILRTTAFCYVTSCSFVYWCQHFDETCCFLLQSREPITSMLTPAIFLSITDRYIPCGLHRYPKDGGNRFLRNYGSYIRITQWLVTLKRMFIKEVRSCSMNRKQQQNIARKLIEVFNSYNQNRVWWRCSSSCSCCCCWRCWWRWQRMEEPRK